MKVRAHCCIGGKSIGELYIVTSTGSILSSLRAFPSSPSTRSSFQVILAGLQCQRIIELHCKAHIGSM
jgi:hypothetical protein